MSHYVDKREYMALLRRLDAVIKERDKLHEQVVVMQGVKEAQAEGARLREQLKLASPFDHRAADRMAAAIDHMVACRCLDARSPAADARLDYGEPFEAEVAKEMFFDCKPAPKREEAKK